MSGHNKWSSIKHRKGAQDSKRGKAFTKLIKEITISARTDGPDPNANPRLRTAITAAKAENMPKDNIERAIKKGSGTLEGIEYEEIIYEGYGPEGSAIILECLTDNKNRTVAEIRYIFNKFGGNLAETGCVKWLFKKKGYIEIINTNIDEEELMDLVLESGAEDIQSKDEILRIITDLSNFEKVKEAIDNSNFSYIKAEIRRVAKNENILVDEKLEKVKKVINTLYEIDDIIKIYTNIKLKN